MLKSEKITIAELLTLHGYSFKVIFKNDFSDNSLSLSEKNNFERMIKKTIDMGTDFFSFDKFFSLELQKNNTSFKGVDLFPLSDSEHLSYLNDFISSFTAKMREYESEIKKNKYTFKYYFSSHFKKTIKHKLSNIQKLIEKIEDKQNWLNEFHYNINLILDYLSFSFHFTNELKINKPIYSSKFNQFSCLTFRELDTFEMETPIIEFSEFIIDDVIISYPNLYKKDFSTFKIQFKISKIDQGGKTISYFLSLIEDNGFLVIKQPYKDQTFFVDKNKAIKYNNHFAHIFNNKIVFAE